MDNAGLVELLKGTAKALDEKNFREARKSAEELVEIFGLDNEEKLEALLKPSRNGAYLHSLYRNANRIVIIQKLRSLRQDMETKQYYKLDVKNYQQTLKELADYYDSEKKTNGSHNNKKQRKN